MDRPGHFSREQLLSDWGDCIWAHCVGRDRVERDVLPCMTVRHLSAGQYLWRAHESPSAWLGVLGGAAKLCMQMADGRAVTLTGVAGSWIGEVALLRPAGRHDCDAIALHDLTLVGLPRRCFEMLYREEPAFARFLMALMAERNWQLMELLASHQLSSPVARVARCLGALITPLNFPGSRARELNVPQSELADFCQLSRPRLNEALAELQRCGLVEISYRRVLIKDLAGVRSYPQRQAPRAAT